MGARRKSGRPRLKYTVKEGAIADARSRKEAKVLDLTKYEHFFRMFVYLRRLFRHHRFLRFIERFHLEMFDYMWLENLGDLRKMFELAFALVEYRFWRRLLPSWFPEPVRREILRRVFWRKLDVEYRRALIRYFRERHKVVRYILENSEYNLARWVAELKASTAREIQKLKMELARSRRVDAPGVCNSTTCKVARFLLRFFPLDKTRFLAYVFQHHLTELFNAARTCAGASCLELEKRELPRRKYLHERYIAIAALGYAMLAQVEHAVLHNVAGQVVKLFPMYLAYAFKRTVMRWVARSMGCRECYDELTICSILTIPEEVYDLEEGRTVKVTSVKHFDPRGEVKYVPGGRVISYRLRVDWAYIRACIEAGECKAEGRMVWELSS